MEMELWFLSTLGMKTKLWKYPYHRPSMQLLQKSGFLSFLVKLQSWKRNGDSKYPALYRPTFNFHICVGEPIHIFIYTCMCVYVSI